MLDRVRDRPAELFTPFAHAWHQPSEAEHVRSAEPFDQADPKRTALVEKLFVPVREDRAAPIRDAQAEELGDMPGGRELQLGVPRQHALPVSEVAPLREDVAQLGAGVIEQ